MHDWGHFSQQVKLKAFKPFTSAANALDNMNAISEGLMHEDLKAFLGDQLPKGQTVGINDSRLLQVVKDELSLAVAGGDIVQDNVLNLKQRITFFLSTLIRNMIIYAFLESF